MPASCKGRVINCKGWGLDGEGREVECEHEFRPAIADLEAMAPGSMEILPDGRVIPRDPSDPRTDAEKGRDWESQRREIESLRAEVGRRISIQQADENKMDVLRSERDEAQQVANGNALKYDEARAAHEDTKAMAARLREEISFAAKYLRESIPETAEENDPEVQMLMSFERVLSDTKPIAEWAAKEREKHTRETFALVAHLIRTSLSIGTAEEIAVFFENRTAASGKKG